MAALRTMAAMAAVALVGHVQATERPLPPCLDPFQPFVYSGCFQDTGSPQILPYRSSAPSDTMTVEKCTAECKGGGYRYAGLVYYGVCYCGQTVNGPAVADSECKLPCNGNSTQTCGGDDIFSVWTDPTFEPVEDVTIEDYDPIGCYTDDSPVGRALAYRQDQLDGATLTTEKCLQACRDGGFPFAGTEFGGECYCGTVLANDTSAVPAGECDKPCNGNPAQTCGGSARLTLFVADELQSLQPCGYEPPVSSSTALPPSSSTSTSVPPESSTSSTTPITSTTTTSSSACVSTTVVPPECEYKCGKWCSSPLPDWDDVKTCKNAWSTCALQVASCFKHAGWPDVLDCFDFGEWCSDISKYCDSKPWGGCRKGDFWGKKPPRGGPKPPTTITITTTCAPATTTTNGPNTTTTTKSSSTSKCPIPTPTNICVQPSSKHYGYGPGKPVGGIEMPVVTCNDLADDWPRYPFKGYNDVDSRKCRKYQRSQCGGACADACKEQYEDCVDVYAEGCRRKGHRGRDTSASASYFEFAHAVEKRTYRWNDSYGSAVYKCKAQYIDCLKENKGVTGAGKCPKWDGC
ncbi:WSC-domain-containing protein [Parathielavia hyrcaniae]|uniref:WSC-domain-containing protein n=1 Tax=Parathielavia hyrcaniae TaxID=113614 RepID=A0AAN6QC11_9PEZI|nr:WSC-domain-containing protein [Parathielavia hyrcaniae]